MLTRPRLPVESAGPIRERMRLIETGELGPTGWSRRADAWARHADALYRACVDLRPAPDVPLRIGVKDTVDVAGFPTRLGTRGYRHDPERSADVLSGLPERAIHAKLVTTELSIGLSHGCVNPYFPHLDPAGSSTGCAVATAAHICDLAMGTDTVASVRLPAAACGVVGLRLTHDDRLLHGIAGLSPHLDSPGWITRTADDLAFLWRTYDLTGGLNGEPQAWRPSDRLRIAVVEEALADDLEPEIRRVFDLACAAIAAAGHEVSSVRLGDLFRRRGLAYELCAREAWDSVQRRVGLPLESLAPSTVLALRAGAAIGDDRYAELLDLHWSFRHTATAQLARDGHDAWLMPAGTMMPRNIHTEPAPPSTIPDPRELGSSPRVNYAAMASFTGLPAITFPIAYSAAFDAPIGLQAIGPKWTEGRLVDLAQTVTELTGGVRYHLVGRVSHDPQRELA